MFFNSVSYLVDNGISIKINQNLKIINNNLYRLAFFATDNMLPIYSVRKYTHVPYATCYC